MLRSFHFLLYTPRSGEFIILLILSKSLSVVVGIKGGRGDFDSPSLYKPVKSPSIPLYKRGK
jgi:hypothetical protein